MLFLALSNKTHIYDAEWIIITTLIFTHYVQFVNGLLTIHLFNKYLPKGYYVPSIAMVSQKNDAFHALMEFTALWRTDINNQANIKFQVLWVVWTLETWHYKEMFSLGRNKWINIEYFLGLINICVKMI